MSCSSQAICAREISIAVQSIHRQGSRTKSPVKRRGSRPIDAGAELRTGDMTMSGDFAKSVDQPASVAPARRNGLLVSMWRRRLLFLGAFVGVFALVVLAYVLLPVTYLATGSVIVAEQEPGIANASAAWAQKIGDPA